MLSVESAVAENGVRAIVDGTILEGLIPGSGRGKQPIACQDGGICEGPASSSMHETNRDPVSAAKPIAQAVASIGIGGV